MRTSTLDDIGDLSAPPGSQAWAIAVRLHLQKKLKDRHDTENRLHEWCELLRQQQGWRVLTDRQGQRFPSWEAFCRHAPPEGLGETADEIETECLRRWGRPTKEESVKGGRSTLKKNTATHWLARLDRDDDQHPGLAARVRSGELKVKTAARMAGIVKTRTPLEQLDHWWTKASPEDRLTFLRKVRVS